MSNINNILTVNPNIIIKQMRDKQKYVLAIINKKYIPIFLKQHFIEIIDFVNNNKLTLNELENKYNAEDIKVLLDGNIISDNMVSSNNLDMLSNLNFEYQMKKLFKMAFSNRTPLNAIFEITYNCNYKCKYCYVEGVKSNMLSIEEIKTILYKLNELGIYELLITGGEPFLHPNIIDIIDISNKLGIVVKIGTNGSFINEDIAKELSKYPNVTINLSYHSCDETTFDKFTRSKNSFKKLIEAVEYLKAYNIQYNLKYTVTKENEASMKEDILFLEKNKYSFTIFTQILPDISNNKDNSKYCVTEESIEWLYKNKYMQFAKSSCSACKTKIWISPSGEVYPCELVRSSIGNILSDDINTIWDGNKCKAILNSKLHTPLEKCVGCDKKDYCNNCLAYLDYPNWNDSLNQFCKTAGVLKKVLNIS